MKKQGKDLFTGWRCGCYRFPSVELFEIRAMIYWLIFFCIHSHRDSVHFLELKIRSLTLSLNYSGVLQLIFEWFWPRTLCINLVCSHISSNLSWFVLYSQRPEINYCCIESKSFSGSVVPSWYYVGRLFFCWSIDYC